MKKLLFALPFAILAAVPVFAQNACELPSDTDVVTKSDVGEFRQKALGIGDFTNNRGECKRMVYMSGDIGAIVFATMDMSDVIEVDTRKNTLVLKRANGKDVSTTKR
jgi:hypothetical protein